jgi:hypothetical protein
VVFKGEKRTGYFASVGRETEVCYGWETDLGDIETLNPVFLIFILQFEREEIVFLIDQPPLCLSIGFP